MYQGNIIMKVKLADCTYLYTKNVTNCSFNFNHGRYNQSEDGAIQVGGDNSISDFWGVLFHSWGELSTFSQLYPDGEDMDIA